MPNYRVSTKPVTSLSDDELRDEAGTLRVNLNRAYNDLSTKAAWARAERRTDDPEYLAWKARTTTFRGKLETRYTEVREELRRRQRASSASNA